MLRLENTEVIGWEQAIRGARNPMNSWDKMDSIVNDWVEIDVTNEEGVPCKDAVRIHSLDIGPNDLDLMKRLCKAGTDHRKFMRMIAVYVDITAPLYWWKEFDTYKVGTVANSCSTMHKIHAKEFVFEDFSHEHLIDDWVDENNDSMYYWKRKGDDLDVDMFATPLDGLRMIIGLLNSNREAYLETAEKLKNKDLTYSERKHFEAKKKRVWWQMIQLLPTSYNQKRTVMLNYEVLANIYKARKNHKLDEWHVLCEWIESLPYSELITGKKEE